jgi:hypothetical protein
MDSAQSFSLHSEAGSPDPNISGNQINMSPLLPASPSESVYRFSAWVKNGSNSGTARFGMREVDENDTTVCYTWVTIPPNTDYSHLIPFLDVGVLSRFASTRPTGLWRQKRSGCA